jgi:hypothetical protein
VYVLVGVYPKDYYLAPSGRVLGSSERSWLSCLS